MEPSIEGAEGISPVDAAWLAGYLEGEGCFSFGNSGKTPNIVAVSTDSDVIDKVAAITDAGSVTRKRSKQPNWKPQSVWRVNRVADVERVLRCILPYMGARRAARIRELLAACGGIKGREVYRNAARSNRAQ